MPARAESAAIPAAFVAVALALGACGTDSPVGPEPGGADWTVQISAGMRQVDPREPAEVAGPAAAPVTLCSPCTTSAACASSEDPGAVCVDHGAQGAFCGGSCDGASCPAGFACLPVPAVDGPASLQCVPVDASASLAAGACSCPASAVATAAYTTCTLPDAPPGLAAHCLGTRVCLAGGLTPCLPAPTAVEACNGIDDDCDGLTDDAACDDGNACTADACDLQAAACVHVALAAACDADGSACTSGDACLGGACVAGPVLGCDDGDACTLDGCHAQTGCVHIAAQGVGCEDGDPCTAGDTCLDGACAAGGPVDCPDASDCLVGVCSPVDGACGVQPAKVGGSCDDGIVCTVDDACDASGECLGHPDHCEDGNACTNDACDPAAGCVHVETAQPCDDGDPCTLSELCIGGDCTAGAATCDDGNPCTADVCDPGTGACEYQPQAGPCDDGDTCSQADLCAEGTCHAGPVVIDCDDANACTVDVCMQSGGCLHLAIAGCTVAVP